MHSLYKNLHFHVVNLHHFATENFCFTLNYVIWTTLNHKMEHDYGIRPAYLPRHYASCTSPLRSSFRFSASRAWQSALIKQFVTEAGAKFFLYRGFELIAFLWKRVGLFALPRWGSPLWWDGSIHRTRFHLYWSHWKGLPRTNACGHTFPAPEVCHANQKE